MDRLLSKLERKKCVEFLSDGLEDRYIDHYKQVREQFLKTKDIDLFLKAKHQKLVNTLITHKEEGTLFHYTQQVDDQVIEHVKNDQTIETGIREGNQVIITKIPYMVKQYLNETNDRKKRYYYCHCPWVREALLEEEKPVSSIFCNCSGGYYKNFWEGVLNKPVKVELLNSILKGDNFCRFALILPQDFLTP